MLSTQAHSAYKGSHIDLVEARLPRIAIRAAPVITGLGAVVLILLGREVPSPFALAFCVLAFFVCLFYSRMEQGSYNRRELNLWTMLSRARELYNSVPYGLFVCGEEGLIKDINATLLEFCGGRSKDFVEKKSVSDLLTPASRKKFWDFVSLSRREVGWVRNVNLEFTSPSGNSRTFLCSICYEVNGSGNAPIKCITADVTESWETRDMLAETRTSFRRFTEQLDKTGVIRCDLDGKITFVNTNACLILLRRPDELTGRNISQLSAEEDAELIRGDIKSATAVPDRKFSVDRILRHPDGSSFLSRISMVPARTEAGTPGLIITLDDLSEKMIQDSWQSWVVSNRESTIHLGRCLCELIEDLCEALYVHRPKYTSTRFKLVEAFPEELAHVAQLFATPQVLSEMLNFAVSAMRVLLYQLSRSIVARDADNVLLCASVIEMIAVKLKLKKLEESCREIETEATSESWQQVELCASLLKKEVEEIQILTERVLQESELEGAAV
jgi:PAS domain S-box-containing protein